MTKNATSRKTAGTELVFRPDDGPYAGFTNLAADRDRGDDVTTVRELIQNALDASDAASRRCDVRFEAIACSWGRIPHMDRYRAAFKSAKENLESDEPATGKNAIGRIESALSKDLVDCLICVDAGEGIAPAALRSLYGTGRSTKPKTGRGSVGHGHLTAFAPSDLRYVLYAARHKAGTLFGGHAILATHFDQSGVQHHPDGFIRSADLLARKASFQDETGGTSLPEFLAGFLPEGSTGSAVAIVGYDPINGRSSRGDLYGLVRSTIAEHFLVAMVDGKMKVTVKDSRGKGRRAAEIGKTALGESVAAVHPPRAQRAARSRLDTLLSGREVPKSKMKDLGPGVRIWVRTEIDRSEDTKPRVSLFRDGMWIVDNLPAHLAPKYFPDCAPFNAVVDLSSDRPNSMGRLVRQAEGASHKDVNPKELPKEDASRLRRLLGKLRDVLSDSADKASPDKDDYMPPELRINVTGIAPLPKRVPKKLPSHVPDEPDEDENDSDGDSDQDSSEGQNKSKSSTKNKIQIGSSSGVSVSCRPDPDDPYTYYASWEISGELPERIAVKLLLPSGTDQTSEVQVKDEYLGLDAIECTNSSKVSGNGTEFILNPAGSKGSAEVRLKLSSQGSVRSKDRSSVRAEVLRLKS